MPEGVYLTAADTHVRQTDAYREAVYSVSSFSLFLGKIVISCCHLYGFEFIVFLHLDRPQTKTSETSLPFASTFHTDSRTELPFIPRLSFIVWASTAEQVRLYINTSTYIYGDVLSVA